MRFRQLFDWLRRPSRGHLRIVLYTRPGCHLCEQAWAVLRAEQRRGRFVLEAVDVDGDPDLTARYGDWVPVIAVNNQVRFRGGVNPVLLRRLLRAEAKQRPG